MMFLAVVLILVVSAVIDYPLSKFPIPELTASI